MANPNNHGLVIGRMAGPVRVFTNRDGSRVVKLALYARRNYRNTDGRRDSDRVEFEAFVPAHVEGLGVYDLVHTGDLLSVSYSLRSSTYEHRGETVYSMTLRVEDMTMLEGRSVTSQRLYERRKAALAKATASDQRELRLVA